MYILLAGYQNLFADISASLMNQSDSRRLFQPSQLHSQRFTLQLIEHVDYALLYYPTQLRNIDKSGDLILKDRKRGTITEGHVAYIYWARSTTVRETQPTPNPSTLFTLLSINLIQWDYYNQLIQINKQSKDLHNFLKISPFTVFGWHCLYCKRQAGSSGVQSSALPRSNPVDPPKNQPFAGNNSFDPSFVWRVCRKTAFSGLDLSVKEMGLGS